MASGIYKIVNLKNGKMYVGSSKSIKDRWWEHRKFLRENRHPSPRLQNSWNKHKEENFVFLIIEVVKDFNKLIEREQYWLDYFQSFREEKGFNIRIKAKSNLGMVHTAETRAKIGKASKMRIVSSDTRKKMAVVANNQWMDPERRKSVSEKAREQWSDPNRRNKLLSGLLSGIEKRRKQKWEENLGKVGLFQNVL